MNDFLRLLVVFVAAANPAFVVLMAGRPASRAGWLAAVAAACAVALGVAAVAAAAGEEIIDFLDVAPETFRVGAGIVLLVGGVRTLLWPPGWEDRSPAGTAIQVGAALAFPLLVTPELVAAAVSYGVDEGVGKAMGAAAIALLVTAALLAAFPARPAGTARLGLWGAARLSGGLLAALACGLIVSGVRDV